jgi:flagellar protein FliT
MNTHNTITLYEQLAQLTREMLYAAQRDDWDRLVALETQCSQKIQTLRSLQPAPLLSGALREQKVTLINRILADDRAIRSLTEPWMTRLATLINSTGTERKLSRTYTTLSST